MKRRNKKGRKPLKKKGEEMKQIADFDAGPTCPKCDNDCTADDGIEIDVKYCPKLGSKKSCQGWKGEHDGAHLHITCERCHYVWIMVTNLDNTITDEAERANPNKDFSADCIMCDEKRLEMQYCSKSGNLPECTETPLPKEHLHMLCTLCGVKYMTKTAEDADGSLEEFTEGGGELSDTSTVEPGRTVTVVGEEEEEVTRGTPR